MLQPKGSSSHSSSNYKLKKVIFVSFFSYIVPCHIQYGHFYCRLQVTFCVSSQDMLHLEAEVKNLHAAVEQIQVTLASPDLHRLSLREQLTQRQVTIYF